MCAKWNYWLSSEATGQILIQRFHLCILNFFSPKQKTVTPIDPRIFWRKWNLIHHITNRTWKCNFGRVCTLGKANLVLDNWLLKLEILLPRNFCSPFHIVYKKGSSSYSVKTNVIWYTSFVTFQERSICSDHRFIKFEKVSAQIQIIIDVTLAENTIPMVYACIKSRQENGLNLVRKEFQFVLNKRLPWVRVVWY